MQKIINFIKSLFHYEPYKYKGSSPELYEMYLNAKELVSKQTVSTSDISEALSIIDEMIKIAKTNGDADLMREVQAKIRDLIGTTNL